MADGGNCRWMVCDGGGGEGGGGEVADEACESARVQRALKKLYRRQFVGS